jgi:hypothetical protein
MIDRATYDRYLAAFNARDYDAVADFYVQPPTLSFFGVEIRSREQLRTFYKFLHSYVRETVTVTAFAASEELTAVDAVVRIEAFRDLDAATLAANGCAGFLPVKAGEIQEIRQFLHYAVTRDKFAGVECALPAG